MTIRIGDAAQSFRINDSIATVRSRMSELQMDISTGKNTRQYADIAGDSNLLVNSKEQRALAEGFIGQNEQVIDRMTTMEGALGSIVDVAERFRNVLLQRMDDSAGGAVPLDTEAASMRDQVASLLNMRLDERYLFSGSKTDQRPVVLPATPITTVDPTLYYEGDDVNLSVRAEIDIEVEYGVTANETAFARLIGTFGSAADAHVAGDRPALEASLQQVTIALEELGELRGRLGVNTARVESVTDGQRSSLNYLDQVISRIEDTNLPEAITAISSDQANLEATYATITRINQLSLADYLR